MVSGMKTAVVIIIGIVTFAYGYPANWPRDPWLPSLQLTCMRNRDHRYDK